MKRSAVQCVAGAVGATLIVVGSVWTCRQLASPTELKAETGAPQAASLSTASVAHPLSASPARAGSAFGNAPNVAPAVVANGKSGNAAAASSLKLSPATATARRGANGAVRPASDSQLKLMLLDDETPSDEATAPGTPFALETVDAPTVPEPAPLADSETTFDPEFSDAETISVAEPTPLSGDPLVAPEPLSTEPEPLQTAADAWPDDANFPNFAETETDAAFPTFPTETAPLAEPQRVALAPEDAPLQPELPAQPEDSLGSFDDALLSDAPESAAAPLETPPSTPPSFAEEVAPQAPQTAAPQFAPSTPSFDFETPSAAASEPIVEPAPVAVSAPPAEPVGRAVPGDKALDGPQSAQIVVEKSVPEEIQVDQEAIFRVVVKNVGETTARGVVLRDALPAGTRFVAAEPSVQPTAQGEFVWPAFDLEAGREKAFEYRIVPTQEGEIGSVASVSFAVEASGRARCVKPELTVEVVAPKEATLGENVDFEIVVANVGSGAATGVELTETIPDGLHHPSGSVLNNELGTLAPGETKRLPLTLQCAASGPTVNKLVVAADGGIEKIVETEIKILAPALELSIDGSATPYLERPATYRLTVKNVGDAAAKDVKLVAELPKGTEFVSANNLGAYKDDVRSVYWDLAELPVAAEGEIELTLKPVQIATSKLTFGGTGPNNLTAQVTQDVAIDGLPALSYNVKTSKNPIEVGKEVEYEIQLVNSGTKATTNALLQVALPATMEVVSTDGPTRPRSNGSTLVFDKIREIPAKSAVVYKVKAKSKEPGDCRVGFQVSSDDLTPLVKEENTRVYR